jgi:hypothetical protein
MLLENRRQVQSLMGSSPKTRANLAPTFRSSLTLLTSREVEDSLRQLKRGQGTIAWRSLSRHEPALFAIFSRGRRTCRWRIVRHRHNRSSDILSGVDSFRKGAAARFQKIRWRAQGAAFGGERDPPEMLRRPDPGRYTALALLWGAQRVPWVFRMRQTDARAVASGASFAAGCTSAGPSSLPRSPSRRRRICLNGTGADADPNLVLPISSDGKAWHADKH